MSKMEGDVGTAKSSKRKQTRTTYRIITSLSNRQVSYQLRTIYIIADRYSHVNVCTYRVWRSNIRTGHGRPRQPKSVQQTAHIPQPTQRNARRLSRRAHSQDAQQRVDSEEKRACLKNSRQRNTGEGGGAVGTGHSGQVKTGEIVLRADTWPNSSANIPNSTQTKHADMQGTHV